MADKYHLTKADRDLLGRELKRTRGLGKGELPLPRRRRGLVGGAAGQDGASGTFVCTINVDVGPTVAGDAVEMESVAGTVFAILPGGELDSLDEHTIYNPFRSTLPSAVNGNPVQYVCDKTAGSETEDGADDEYTISGVDPYWLFAALTGFGAGKLLVATGPDPANMEWDGQCESFVTDVECVDDEIQVTTTTYIAIACTP